MNSKSTLRYYKNKTKFGGSDHMWDNSKGSSLLFKARSDALELNANLARWHTSDDETCRLCNSSSEDLPHFLLHCPALGKLRAEDKDCRLLLPLMLFKI